MGARGEGSDDEDSDDKNEDKSRTRTATRWTRIVRRKTRVAWNKATENGIPIVLFPRVSFASALLDDLYRSVDTSVSCGSDKLFPWYDSLYSMEFSSGVTHILNLDLYGI